MFARTAELYGRILYYNGHLKRAVVVHEEALAAYQSTEGGGSFHAMQIHVDLAWFGWTSGNFDTALAACNSALEILEAAAGANDPRAMAITSIQARLQMERGRIDDSQRTVDSTIRAIEQLQGLRTPLMCGVFLQIAHVLLNLGFPLRAKSWAQESLSLGQEIFSEHHALMAASRCVLGQALVAVGELESARAMFAATTESLRRTRLPLNQHVCIAPSLLADVLISMGEMDEAKSLAEEAERVLAMRVSGDATLVRAQHAITRAHLAAHDAHPDRATALAAEGDEMIVQRYGAMHPYRLSALLAVGQLTRNRGQIDAATRCHELAMEIGRSHGLNLHPTVAEHLLALAAIAEAHGDHEMTAALKVDALEACRQRLGPTSKAVLAIS